MKSEGSPSKEELAKWESELSQLMDSERDHLEDIGKTVQGIYEIDDRHYDVESLRYDDEGIPSLGPYVFGALTIFTPLKKIGLISPRHKNFREKQPISRLTRSFFSRFIKSSEGSPRTKWLFL